LTDGQVQTLHKSLVEVMAAGGTGGRAAVPGVLVGGKTGSAENPQGEKTHALFMACAPIDTPAIAISAVLENAGHGGSVAAPVAGAVLRYYFLHDAEGKQIAERLSAADTTKKKAR
jgi:cell division protein FtsI/penicillin-binding protein 2